MFTAIFTARSEPVCRDVFPLVLVVVLVLACVLPAAGQIPATVDLGEIPDSRPVSAVLLVRNPSRLDVARVDILSGSSAVMAEPETLVLDPGEGGEVELTYAPEGYPGDIARRLLIRSSLAQLDDLRVLIKARVRAPVRSVPSAASECDECLKFEELFSEERRLADLEASVVLIDLYYNPACSECVSYLKDELPRVAVSAGRLPRVALLDVTQTRWQAQLRGRLQHSGLPPGDMPVAFVEGEVYQGLDAIRSGVRTAFGL